MATLMRRFTLRDSRLSRRWAIAIAAFCASSGLAYIAYSLATAKRNGDDLFIPITVGTKWIYEGPDRDLIVVVTGVEEVDRGTIVRTGWLLVDEIHPWERLILSQDGLYRAAANGDAVNPPVLLLRFPIRSGDKWEHKSVFHGTACEGTTTVVGEETIEVPAGKFRATKVLSVYTLNGTEHYTITWFARRIGVVKDVSSFGNGGEWTVSLKEFVPAPGK